MESYYLEEYTVVNIVSDESIIVNCGFNAGVKKNEQLEIVNKGEEIIYKGNNLGSFDLIKEIVTVTEVFENFSICQKVVKKPSPFTSNLVAATSFQNSIFKSTESIEKLDVDKSEISNLKKPDYTPISIGDKVNRIVLKNK